MLIKFFNCKKPTKFPIETPNKITVLLDPNINNLRLNFIIMPFIKPESSFSGAQLSPDCAPETCVAQVRSEKKSLDRDGEIKLNKYIQIILMNCTSNFY